ncbi:MAG: hypothetical protein NTW25_04275 [Candidatus Kapabacteria bacterium]|nr:hypothetical protein [Candidatus Kapabacteria bacterium]
MKLLFTSICLLSENRDSIVSASVINYFSGNNKPLFNKINRFGKIINRVEVGELQDKYSSPLAIGKVDEFYVTANTPSFSLFQNENDLVIRFYDKNFIQVIDKKISPQILDLNNKFILVSKLIVQDNKIYIIGNSKDSKSIKRGFLIILDSKGELISKATFSSNSSFNSFLVGQDYVHIVGNITNDSNSSKFLYVKYSLNNRANSEYIWGSNSNSNNLNDVVVDNSNNLIVAGSEENNGYIAGLNQSITSIPEESSNEILFQLEVSSLNLEIKSNQFIENQNADIINIIGSSQKVEIVNNRIDISSFTSGFYLLKFQIGSDFKIVKFLILK